MEFQPADDLALLLDCSRLIHHVPVDSTLVVSEEGSLRDAVGRRCVRGVTAPVRGLRPGPQARDEYGNWYTETAIAAWTADQSLFGQLAVCSCGEPGCGATYAWIEEDRCLLLVEVVAAGITRIEVGPFALA
jgi:hypothetical protein